MTDYQFWSLIINAFIAVGTVGAVIISLYATLAPKIRYKIHNAQACAKKNALYPQHAGYEECYLKFDVENLLDVHMQIFEARIYFKGSENNQSLILGAEQASYVPPKNRYNVIVPLSENKVQKGTCTACTKVIVTLGTSLGDKVAKLKNPELLCKIIESDDEYVNLLEPGQVCN